MTVAASLITAVAIVIASIWSSRSALAAAQKSGDAALRAARESHEAAARAQRRREEVEARQRKLAAQRQIVEDVVAAVHGLHSAAMLWRDHGGAPGRFFEKAAAFRLAYSHRHLLPHEERLQSNLRNLARQLESIEKCYLRPERPPEPDIAELNYPEEVDLVKEVETRMVNNLGHIIEGAKQAGLWDRSELAARPGSSSASSDGGAEGRAWYVRAWANRHASPSATIQLNAAWWDREWSERVAGERGAAGPEVGGSVAVAD